MATTAAFFKMLRSTDLKVVAYSSRVSGSLIGSRASHSYSISSNVDLHSDESYQRGTNKYKLEGTNSSDRRLTLLFPWMMSKEKHVKKYADIYLKQGFDVVTVKVPPYDLFRPTKGSQISVGHLLNFLQENYWSSPIFVHCLSVGVYCFGELLAKMAIDPNGKDIHNRLTGQIYDSAVDVHGLPKAMGKVLSSHKAVQDSLEMSLNWFLKTNYETATKHYKHAAKHIYENAAKAPVLFIFSKSDPVSPPEMNLNVINFLRNLKEPVYTKCFEKSSHVSHFQQYQKEYLSEVNALLDMVGLGHSTKCSGRASATA